MKDLCAAMGIEWHGHAGKAGAYHLCSCQFGYRSKELLEKHATKKNPSHTDPAFCWRALTYMLHRDDWNDFYYSNQEEWLFRDPSDKNYYRWLFDPARFIELADDWVREHEEVESD